MDKINFDQLLYSSFANVFEKKKGELDFKVTKKIKIFFVFFKPWIKLILIYGCIDSFMKFSNEIMPTRIKVNKKNKNIFFSFYESTNKINFDLLLYTLL